MLEEQTKAVKVIATALNELRKRVGYVEKTGKNPHFQYDYVEEASLMALVRKHMIEVGLVMTPRVSPGSVQVFRDVGPKNNMAVVFVQEYNLAHVDGHVWPWPISVVAAGQDSGDKHVWKASTGANKYAVMRMLQLATGDDPEKDHGLDNGAGGGAPSGSPARSGTPAQGAPDLAGYDLNAKATAAILKDLKVWNQVFARAEAVYGKAKITADQELKFHPMNDFLQARGLQKQSDLRVSDLPALYEFLPTWGVGHERGPQDHEPPAGQGGDPGAQDWDEPPF